MLTYNIDFQPDYLKVTLTGIFEIESALELIPSVIAASRKYSLNKIIIDYSEMTGEIGYTQKIIFAMETGDYYLQHRTSDGDVLRVAYLASPSQVNSWKPGVEVAARYHLETLVTTDKEEAINWLCREKVNAGKANGD